MKIEVNVTKKRFFALLISIFVIAGLVAVYALQSMPGTVPNPGHSLESIQGYFEGDMNLTSSLDKFCQSDGTNCQVTIDDVFDVVTREFCLNFTENEEDYFACPSTFYLRGFESNRPAGGDSLYTCCGQGQAMLVLGWDNSGNADPDCWIKSATNLTIANNCQLPAAGGALTTDTQAGCVQAALSYYNSQNVFGSSGGWSILSWADNANQGGSTGLCSDSTSDELIVVLNRN